MAIQQTLCAKNSIWTPNEPLTNANIHFLSLNHPPSVLNFNKRSSSLGRLKCSYMDYYNNYNGGSGGGNYERSMGPLYPRPAEIEWKKELCNSVQLIGIVGTPVQINQLTSGEIFGWCRLAVRNSATDTSWVDLTFWSELAFVASQHIEKGNKISVSGHLVSDTVESDDGKQQTYYKVVVQKLNFIARSFSTESTYHEDTNPATQGNKFKNCDVNNTRSIEELWQAYFANPVEWWDNRKDKRTPNYPDFKHKDTGEALWIESRNNPSWVKSQLLILDTKMESYHYQNAGMHKDFMASDFSPY